MLWRVFYNSIVVPLLWAGFQLIGLFDAKTARGIRGRRGLLTRLEREVSALDPGRKRIWFHSSSMGEFEQAKPIIAECKKRYPEVDIIISFFSPSGFEHSRIYKPAAINTYLPFDSRRNAEKFVKSTMPAAAVFMRYDVWPNHLWALQGAGIPTIIASATLRENTLRNLPVVKQFHRTLYDSLDYILTVSEDDKKAFESFRLEHPVVGVIGDTRYDQVMQRSAESRTRQVLDPRILAGKKVLVAGSSWKEDEERLLPACQSLFRTHPELLVILVPHEPTIENLERVESNLNGAISSVRFSALNEYNNEQLILIDSVGILMPLYQYAHVAYVGGSFHQGIHNVLEPAAYGTPILCGPRHENSQEAIRLVKEGAAFVGRDSDELHGHLRSLLDDEARRKDAGEKASAFVCRNVGATQRFFSSLEKVL
jgi:3-deoxy-D-manno-octulosonic-acid transferase